MGTTYVQTFREYEIFCVDLIWNDPFINSCHAVSVSRAYMLSVLHRGALICMVSNCTYMNIIPASVRLLIDGGYYCVNLGERSCNTYVHVNKHTCARSLCV